MSQILNNLVLYQIPVSVSTFEHLDHLLTPHILQYYSDEFLFFQTSQQIIIIALYIQYALRYYDPSHCTLSLLAYPNQHPRLVCICLKIRKGEISLSLQPLYQIVWDELHIRFNALLFSC